MIQPDPDRFSSAVDRLLAGKRVDISHLPEEEARALQIVRQVAGVQINQTHRRRERLRKRLEARLDSLDNSRQTALNRGWAPWLGLAIIAILFLNGAFNGLAPLGGTTPPALATALAAPLSASASSTSLTYASLIAHPQPDPMLHALELPQPVPTPLAPPGASLPALEPSATTPGNHAPVATP